MTASRPTRRAFLRTASALGAAGAATPFALNLATMAHAVAQSASGYRALVYVNLAGGNDAHNMVLATDTESAAAYRKYRDTSATDGAKSIALPASSLLPLTTANAAGVNTGRSFALHPRLVNLQGLMNGRRAAVVSNVGPMIQPTSAAQYQARSVTLPKDLYSHNSQSATWQAFSGEGSRYGWGGRLADLLLASNTRSTFTCISASGNAVFLSGQSAVQLQVGSSGLLPLNGLVNSAGASVAAVFTPYGGEAPDTTTAAYRRILTRSRSRSDLYAQDVSQVHQRSIDAQASLAASLVPATAVAVPPTGNGLASQLQTVLRIMASASALGVTRQVFYVSMGGFDTHDDQITRHDGLMKSLDDAIAYFETAATTLGLQDSATLFTGSEFGRTFTSNGDGCDHGWGAHHLVVGGAVRGGDVYGRFPTLGVNNADNVGAALLPQYAVDQYGATLARWLGVSDGSLNDVFPNLSRFATRDLGFMSA